MKSIHQTRQTPGLRAPLAVLSALALAIALSACGQEEQAPATSAPATEAPPAAPATEPAPEPAAAPAASTPATPGTVESAASNLQDTLTQAANTTAAALDDAGITAKVKAELIKDNALSALNVSVETKGGLVTLSGTVPSAQASERVESLAKGIAGVTGVTNSLTVTAGS